ncbi:hypothetical protein VCRA2128O305_310032 [Vibrio crassostreae]|nr:hypothetical protein VCRA2113O222_280038 [Vibrio crassostreae]CAK1950356.1 hypothetical protein VCRA2113O221_280038 [Vibrio crassostreae]CAK1954805.1 hypothetical protein VCRA2113O213_270074 [Vibrio crassostreae]CAK2027813.1 hypothetical protein VCRA2116O234_320032 [Vibrio crassostreae]CAK2037490.1 hypothetical protein VCRA2112O187_370031 [Vibrio crassostreae]
MFFLVLCSEKKNSRFGPVGPLISERLLPIIFSPKNNNLFDCIEIELLTAKQILHNYFKFLMLIYCLFIFITRANMKL